MVGPTTSHRSVWSLGLGLIAAAAWVPPALAQSLTFGDWVVECAATTGQKQQCALRQRLADEHGRKIIEFTAATSGKTPYLEVNAPLGLSIPHGVTLKTSDAHSHRMQLIECEPGGCRALLALDDKTLRVIRAASSVSVSFQDSKSGKVLTVPGSLKGFAQGLAVVLAAAAAGP